MMRGGPPVDDLQRGARTSARRDLDPERGVRGHDDQRMRRQLDRGIVADDQPPGTREVVVDPRRAKAAHVEAVALADQTLRQPDELHHQRIDETVEIRCSDGRARLGIVGRAWSVHRSILRNRGDVAMRAATVVSHPDVHRDTRRPSGSRWTEDRSRPGRRPGLLKVHRNPPDAFLHGSVDARRAEEVRNLTEVVRGLTRPPSSRATSLVSARITPDRELQMTDGARRRRSVPPLTELAWPSTWTDCLGRDRPSSIPGHEMAGVVTDLG
jgi:hypothetical protein